MPPVFLCLNHLTQADNHQVHPCCRSGFQWAPNLAWLFSGYPEIQCHFHPCIHPNWSHFSMKKDLPRDYCQVIPCDFFLIVLEWSMNWMLLSRFIACVLISPYCKRLSKNPFHRVPWKRMKHLAYHKLW